MLRHQGTRRTHRDNIQLASLLSFTAGFVNAAGFLAFAVLTTNVTGHAALFAERLAFGDWLTARIVALWMLLFLTGAFVSSVLIARFGKARRSVHVIPMCIEISLLLMVFLFGHYYDGHLVGKEIFAGGLLFSMGMQNALVSVISGSVVRTTHLTGTFTDLGIELAQLITRKKGDSKAFKAKIRLRLSIIGFFMSGALAGAYLFKRFHFNSFVLPVTVLVISMIYDVLRVNIKRFYHKHPTAEQPVGQPSASHTE